MARRCLYYPFIHFRDEGWLKLSALYWDDVTRIVPRSYEPRDNREVRALEDAGVVKRVDPSAYEQPVGDLFTVLLERYQAKLVRRYDVSERGKWPANLERFGVKTGSVSASSLAFIHCSKLEPELTERLLKLKLALPSRDRRWLGMHPAIVSAYMIALASEIAKRRGLSPISDNAMHLSGVTSCAVEDLARALVSDVNLSRQRPAARAQVQPKKSIGGAKRAEVTAERVAFVTLRAVLPARLDAIPSKRIIELRARHAGARHAFHAYVEDVRAQLASAEISEPSAIDEHVRLEYERRLKPELDELSRGLRSLGVGTFLGTFGMAVTLPVGSLLGAAPAAVAAAVAGATLGVAALSHKQQGSAAALFKPSPSSFLFVTEQLRPRTLAQRLSETVRRFSLGV
jgi:hypothetical protein